MRVDYYEQIEDYRENRLSADERANFENEMSADPDLKEAVELFPLIIETLTAASQDNAWKVLDQAQHRETWVVSLKGKSNIRYLFSNKVVAYAISAVLLVLVVMIPVWNSIMHEPDPGEIYASFYQKYPNLESVRGDGDELDAISQARNDAYTAYDLEDYPAFISYITSLPQGYSREGVDQFYLGISYLEEEQWQEAIVAFQKVSNSSTQYAAEAKWYLGLGYIAGDDCESARSVFISIQRTGSARAAEATEILKKLSC